MRNLFAALLYSVVLHAGLATLVYLSEATPGKTVRAGTPGTTSAPLNISLTLISSDVERTALDSVPAEQETESRDSEPLPALLVSDNSSTGNSTGSQSAVGPADQPPQEGVIYYPSSQLTSRPVPQNEVVLGTTETLFVAANGAIVLTLWIDALGEVAEVTVETADIPDDIASGLVAAFKQLRFAPGRLGDQTVRVAMKIEVAVN